MAPPSPRRPGFSRRAHYSLFASYVAALIGALVGLLLMVTARFDPAGHAALQGFLSDIFAPVSSAGRGTGAAIGSAFDDVGAYFDAASKNREMKLELEAARRDLIKGKADALEVRRLKQLAALVERLPEGRVTARLVSSTGASSRRIAILAAGRADGVVSGQPVRTADGLVGRVIAVGRHSAHVLLMIDGGNIVPVKRVPDGAPALAYGLGDGRLDLRPLAAGTNPFNVGDIFVTSGTGGVYQPGIPVAIGIRHNREGTIGRPLADPSRFDFAVVEPEFAIPPPSPPEPGGKARQ
ncbi:MAG: rod shape-determining protein MreC [Sphingomonadales bacterium]|nr:rod shape-determining protein MreC [Sphingomonadales bacterium]